FILNLQRDATEARLSLIPPTQLVDCSYSTYNASASGTLFLTSHQCSWWDSENLVACVHRLSMNDPPTALVGFGLFAQSLACVGFGLFAQSLACVGFAHD